MFLQYLFTKAYICVSQELSLYKWRCDFCTLCVEFIPTDLNFRPCDAVLNEILVICIYIPQVTIDWLVGMKKVFSVTFFSYRSSDTIETSNVAVSCRFGMRSSEMDENLLNMVYTDEYVAIFLRFCCKFYEVFLVFNKKIHLLATIRQERNGVPTPTDCYVLQLADENMCKKEKPNPQMNHSVRYRTFGHGHSKTSCMNQCRCAQLSIG